ncbi:MFS transporter [Streptomyces diastatochromogenes]|nr:MFS transporter [Streptomyces diastatochromogenes]
MAARVRTRPTRTSRRPVARLRAGDAGAGPGPAHPGPESRTAPVAPPHPAYTPTASPGFGPAAGTVPGAWGAPPRPPTGRGLPRRWAGLAVAVVAQFLVLVGSASTNVALPAIQADLGLPVGDLGTLPFAYGLAFGALLLLGGHLTDLLGRKRAAIIGLAGFAAASVLGGMAPSAAVLITVQALQGGFAALLSSAALALVAGGFTDPRERGRAFGAYGVLAAGGLAVGAFAGGWLVQNMSWRWCFYAAVPLALIAVVPAVRLEDDRSGRTPARLDAPGLLLGTGALVALLLGLDRADAVYGSGGAAGPRPWPWCSCSPARPSWGPSCGGRPGRAARSSRRGSSRTATAPAPSWPCSSSARARPS